MVDAVSGSIESRKDFKKTPSGQYKYWKQELDASEKNLRSFRNEGTKIVSKFKGGKHTNSPIASKNNFKLNLFHTNVITLQSMLYGNLPKIDVSRRNADPNDDVGRVAAEIMERLLNNDVQDNSETYNSVLKAVLQDRLLPGLGVARCRYDYDSASGREDAPLEYFHWRDICWGWGRTFSDLPWIGFRSYLDKDQVAARFGDEVAEKVELQKQSTTPDKGEKSVEEDDGPWQKAQIWEIWDKVEKKVVWVSPGCDKVLESKEDFLKAKGFFPCPPFLLANQTTTLYSPTSDYSLAQDLYNEIDTIQTRISIITEAVKVVGVYNQAAGEIKRMFNEGTDNDLIPVDNWALFAESGGIQGQIDWVPMKDISETLARLRELRDETIGLLQQVTGMSDIMRGQLDNQYEGVGQSQDKTKFGSVRIQSLQEEFATFASNLMQIKADIIGSHYEPENIARLASVDTFMDADKQLIPQAIQLIKTPALARLHILIRPESVAMLDYAQLRGERTEYLTAISTFLQASAPIVEIEPSTAPFMLQLLQWGLAGYKGSSEIEGVVDRAIETSLEAAKNQKDKPDPEKQAQEAAAQLEMMKHQNNMKEIQAKSQANLVELQADTKSDVMKIMADLKADLKVIAAKLNADLQTEAIGSQINVEQNAAGVDAEMQKDLFAHELKLDEMAKAPKPNGGSSE